MRKVRALALAAVAAALAPTAIAQERASSAAPVDPSGLQPPAASPLVGLRQSGPVTGLRSPVAPSGWTGGVFVGPPSGQGLNPARTMATDPGLRVRPDLYRAAEDPRVGPPIDPASAMEAGAYVGYRFDKILVTSAVRQGFGAPGFGGAKLDLGASYGFNVTPRHLITLSGGLTVGQANPLAPYYGALAGDAMARSGYRIGEPGAGFRVSWLYSFGRNLYLSTTLGYDRAYDADGTLGLDRNTTSFGTVFGYRW
jgi:hypothetical protein